MYRYSGYVFKLKCGIDMAATQEGSGCCLQHPTSGGWCLIASDDTGTAASTYKLTASDFSTFTSTYALDPAWEITDDADNDPWFEIFSCPDASENIFSCYKF